MHFRDSRKSGHSLERTGKAAEKYFAEKIQVWQDRLNLRDWDIRFQLVRTNKLEPKTLGNINWDSDVKKATISVLSSYDYTLPYQQMLDDMEFTVVHEMVHLHLASLPRSEASRRVEEHAVNELAAGAAQTRQTLTVPSHFRRGPVRNGTSTAALLPGGS